MLVLANETCGDCIAREIDMFSVGTSVQDVSSAARIKRFPRLGVISNKNEVLFRNYLNVPRAFGELLSRNQLPCALQLFLRRVAIGL